MITMRYAFDAIDVLYCSVVLKFKKYHGMIDEDEGGGVKMKGKKVATGINT
jgi:hypothetical protein